MEQQKLKEVRSHEQAALEDVFFGQSVILWARWSVILAGAVLVLWTSTTVAQLTRTVVVAASVADLVLITGIVAFWPGAVGLNNQFFVLYYPVVFAFALVFPRAIEAGYTVLAIAAYSTVCFVFSGSAVFADGAVNLKTLMMRLIVMAAMGFLGNYYFRIQRDRLRRASQGSPSALEELKARIAPAPVVRRAVRS